MQITETKWTDGNSDYSITPFFKKMTVEDIQQSALAGGVPHFKEVDAVEIRIAGTKHYSPCVRADDFWKVEGGLSKTYIDRWPEEYAAFVRGEEQTVRGTPLELLLQYGVTQGQIAACKALKVYSVEALVDLEGPNAKALGVALNTLKDAASKFMAAHPAAQIDDVAALRAEIEALRSQLAGVVPTEELTRDEAETVVASADTPSDELSDADIKARIKALTGATPKGPQSRDVLLSILAQAEADKE